MMMKQPTDRWGDWIQTYTGAQFWPLDPRPSEVRTEDIAHALSMQCRFAGHCRVFYSVAEHSVRVSQLLRAWGHPPLAQLAGLLHDASEAYLVDVPRPLKPHLPGYSEIERRVMDAICERFGLPRWALATDARWGAVRHADAVLLATEARDLMAPQPVPWEGLPDPLPTIIHQADCLYPSDAREAFVQLLGTLLAEVETARVPK